MKKFNILILLLAALVYMGCQPKEIDEPSVGKAPTEADLDFTIAPGTDAFHFVVTNTSSVTGIATWDLGNGSKASGDVVVANYVLPDLYTVTLTLVTSGGTASITKDIEQTETDFSIFTDPVYVNLTGGVSQVDGKIWVLDSLQTGHIGVGDVNLPGGIGLDWWAAPSLIKSGTAAYNDEIIFNINDFVVTYDNGPDGKSYVKGYQKDDAHYSNPVQNKDDYDVEYATPVVGTWSISERDGSYFLTMSGPTPIYPCFDVGALNNEYEIIQVTENLLELTCASEDENWTKWHYFLIKKGYVKPTVEFDFDAPVATANPNEYACALSNVTMPDGLTISSVVWSFGDPAQEDYTATDENEVVNVTYMPAGTYTVKVTVTDSEGSVYEKTQDIVVASDHPDYTPYIEANMQMYANFDDVFSKIAVDMAGNVASFQLVPNPSVEYVNDGANSVEFTKEYSEWANIYIPLGDNRFDLTVGSKFKVMVYGNAGDSILLKLENTDRGGNAWQTGTYDLKYYIQESNTWEVAEFDFAGVGAGWDWTGDIYTTDVTTDPNFNQGFYNVVRIMINPGNNGGIYSVILDDFAGPIVTGWKK